jgi:hypothetical protein
VVDRNPEAMAAIWSDLRAAARDELESGHRTAQALNWAGRPWDRARFLAIRDNFRADVDPATGFQTALLEIAAESFGDFLGWTESLHMQADTEADLERHDIRRHGKWKPQRLTSSEALAQSARMADRAHTRLLQTLGALAACRRETPALFSAQSVTSSSIIIIATCEVDERRLEQGRPERM